MPRAAAEPLALIKTRILKRAVRLKRLKSSVPKKRGADRVKSQEYLKSVLHAQDADLARETLATHGGAKTKVKHSGFSIPLDKKLSPVFEKWAKDPSTAKHIDRAVRVAKTFKNFVAAKKPSMAKTRAIAKQQSAKIKRILSAAGQAVAQSARKKLGGVTAVGRIVKDFAIFGVALTAALLLPGALLAAEQVLKGAPHAPAHGSEPDDADGPKAKKAKAFEDAEESQSKASDAPELLTPSKTLPKTRPFGFAKNKNSPPVLEPAA